MSEPSAPEWLPPLIPMSPWNEALLEALYTIFRADFLLNPPCYEGSRVWFFPECERDKELIFWHLTEREDPPRSGNRLPDFRRCERLRWARALFDHLDDPGVKSWDFEEGDGDVHTYLWLESCDYVVVMKRYPDGRRRLLTAYWIEYESKRRSLRKKYAKRMP
jgi:hypothetical protein